MVKKKLSIFILLSTFISTYLSSYSYQVKVFYNKEDDQVVISFHDCHNLGTYDENCEQTQNIIKFIDSCNREQKDVKILCESQYLPSNLNSKENGTLDKLYSYLEKEYKKDRTCFNHFESHPLGNSSGNTTLIAWGLPHYILKTYDRSPYISVASFGITEDSVSLKSIDPRKPLQSFYYKFKDMVADIEHLSACRTKPCDECDEALQNTSISLTKVEGMIKSLSDRIYKLDKTKDRNTINLAKEMYKRLVNDYNDFCSEFHNIATSGELTKNDLCLLYNNDNSKFKDLKKSIERYKFLLKSLDLCFIIEATKSGSPKIILAFSGGKHAKNLEPLLKRLNYNEIASSGITVDELAVWAAEKVNRNPDKTVKLNNELKNFTNNLDSFLRSLDLYKSGSDNSSNANLQSSMQFDIPVIETCWSTYHDITYTESDPTMPVFKSSESLKHYESGSSLNTVPSASSLNSSSSDLTLPTSNSSQNLRNLTSNDIPQHFILNFNLGNNNSDSDSDDDMIVI